MKKILTLILILITINLYSQPKVLVPVDFVKWTLLKDDSLQIYKKINIKQEEQINKLKTTIKNDSSLFVIYKNDSSIYNTIIKNDSIIISNKDLIIKKQKRIIRNNKTQKGILLIIITGLILL